jgi:hypothetical protein
LELDCSFQEGLINTFTINLESVLNRKSFIESQCWDVDLISFFRVIDSQFEISVSSFDSLFGLTNIVSNSVSSVPVVNMSKVLRVWTICYTGSGLKVSIRFTSGTCSNRFDTKSTVFEGIFTSTSVGFFSSSSSIMTELCVIPTREEGINVKQ